MCVLFSFMKNIGWLSNINDRLKNKETLSSEEMSRVMRLIMSGVTEDSFVECFLSFLAKRVPTAEELFGATSVMKECVDGVFYHDPTKLLDTCGTGGAPKTFNVSTLSALVCAASGVPVAKHGNKSKTGRGSSEILEALGVNINLNKKQQEVCLQDVGICFCFAPKHHPAVANVMPVRKRLGFPTIFNLIGPLTNPFFAGRQLVGVWDKKYIDQMGRALQLGGVVSGAVVHSDDGLDEISISAPTSVLLVTQKQSKKITIRPEDFGFKTTELNSVVANSLDEAVDFANYVICGENKPQTFMVALNSGVGLFLSGVAKSIEEGVKISFDNIKNGSVKSTFLKWVKVSNNTPST